MKAIGFALGHAPNHIRGFYGRLIEYLSQELGSDFEVIPRSAYPESVWQLDGQYRVIIFGSRGTAASFSKQATISKSFLIDHGILHTNRTPSNSRVDFEVFSSPFLLEHYSGNGLSPLIRAWSTGYFLTADLYKGRTRTDECIVYLTHKSGWRANSMRAVPFDDGSTIGFLRELSGLHSVVRVVSHINMSENFVVTHGKSLPGNVVALGHGRDFMEHIASVGNLFFEYSSVFATALWNPSVRLFERVPPSPTGPVTPQAKLLHRLMDETCYPILGDDLSGIASILRDDVKKSGRHKAHEMIFDGMVHDPYRALLSKLMEACQHASPDDDSVKFT